MATLDLVAALPGMLEHDRKQAAGWSVDKAASRLHVSDREYREIEAESRVAAPPDGPGGSPRPGCVSPASPRLAGWLRLPTLRACGVRPAR
jgi:hypothetical protein